MFQGRDVEEINFLEKVELLFCNYEYKNGNVFTELECDVLTLIQDRLDELTDNAIKFEKERSLCK